VSPLLAGADVSGRMQWPQRLAGPKVSVAALTHPVISKPVGARGCDGKITNPQEVLCAAGADALRPPLLRTRISCHKWRAQARVLASCNACVGKSWVMVFNVLNSAVQNPPVSPL
jgi:hypothetical protein